MNEYVHANVIGWSHTHCQVHVCVCMCSGGSSVYERLWLVFPPEGSTAALERREGGRE